MPINHPGRALPYTADADLAPYTIAAFGSIDGNCKTGTSATDKFLGITDNVAVPQGQVASIVIEGPTVTTYGAPISAGDWLTSDANGNAISVASGVTANVIGQAQETGVAGDIRPILVKPGRVTAQ